MHFHPNSEGFKYAHKLDNKWCVYAKNVHTWCSTTRLSKVNEYC